MGDLQCAATVVVARPGEAEYESESLSAAGGSLTLRGREQARALADALADRNVALIYTSSMVRAVQTAEIVAARLGCVVRVREGLVDGDLAVAVDSAQSAEQIVQRVSDVLDDVADLHRGETVLTVTHGDLMALVLPILAANLSPTCALGQSLRDTAWVELNADADGWRWIQRADAGPSQ